MPPYSTFQGDGLRCSHRMAMMFSRSKRRCVGCTCPAKEAAGAPGLFARCHGQPCYSLKSSITERLPVRSPDEWLCACRLFRHLALLNRTYLPKACMDKGALESDKSGARQGELYIVGPRRPHKQKDPTNHGFWNRLCLGPYGQDVASSC